MRSVRELYELQVLDWEILNLETELAGARARLADDSARLRAKREMDALNARIAQLAAPRRQSENAIERIEERVATIDERLYGGAVSNPRELEAYQDERAALLRNRSAEEDTLLELMVEAEDAEERRDEAKSVFERIHAERSREVAELTARGRELSARLPDLRTRRAELAALYEPATIAVYESVRRTRGGQGAAIIDRRGLCQGCRLVRPNAELSRARAGDRIAQCGNCSRILICE